MYPIAYKDPRGGHSRSYINQEFFRSWSPSIAYILGFIFADGAIEDVQKSSRTCYLAIVSKDISILQKIKEAMNSHHKLYIRPAQMEPYPGNKGYMSGKRFVFRVGSKAIYKSCLFPTTRKQQPLLSFTLQHQVKQENFRIYVFGFRKSTLFRKKVCNLPKISPNSEIDSPACTSSLSNPLAFRKSTD